MASIFAFLEFRSLYLYTLNYEKSAELHLVAVLPAASDVHQEEWCFLKITDFTTETQTKSCIRKKSPVEISY